eukprot:3753196-Pleurochrysis_carterae.AAC.1
MQGSVWLAVCAAYSTGSSRACFTPVCSQDMFYQRATCCLLDHRNGAGAIMCHVVSQRSVMTFRHLGIRETSVMYLGDVGTCKFIQLPAAADAVPSRTDYTQRSANRMPLNLSV